MELLEAQMLLLSLPTADVLRMAGTPLALICAVQEVQAGGSVGAQVPYLSELLVPDRDVFRARTERLHQLILTARDIAVSSLYENELPTLNLQNVDTHSCSLRALSNQITETMSSASALYANEILPAMARTIDVCRRLLTSSASSYYHLAIAELVEGSLWSAHPITSQQVLRAWLNIRGTNEDITHAIHTLPQ